MIRRRVHDGIQGRIRSIKLYLSKTKRALALVAL
jgi:hypothetical protein